MAGGASDRGALAEAVRGQRRQLALASVLTAAHQGGEALVPVIIGVVIDQAVSTGSVTALVQWLVVLAVVFAVLSTSYRFGARAAERAAEVAAHRLRVRLTERVLHPGGGAEAGRLPGALVNIATGDAKRVGTVNGVLPFGVAGLAGLLVSAVLLLHISVPLGLVVLLGTPPLLLLTHFVGKPLERRSGDEQERAAHASGVAADLVAGLRVLKGIGAEAAAVARYRDTSRMSLRATLRAASARAGHDGAILALTGGFIVIVALVGAGLAAEDAISIGELIAAVGLAQFLLGPFQIFSWVNGELAQGRASAKRVDAVLSAPPAVTAGGRALEGNGAGWLRLRAVSSGPVRELDLHVRPGELVGLVTAEQQQARALLDCLGREQEPESGTIELNGIPVTELDPEAVRGAMLVAAHDADLFAGTLADNVTAATTGQERLELVLAASGADEVARSLPGGTAAPIVERGRSLSGGQRQRVALARALAADPPVLVVHDPTTAVDSVTESRIATELRALRRERTTVLVTTSPALLAVTDRVVVLGADGVGAGTHAELVRTDAAYRAAVLS